MSQVQLFSTKQLTRQQCKAWTLGFALHSANFIRIEPLPLPALPNHWQGKACIFTSVNGVNHLIQRHNLPKNSDLPIFCVGEKTAQALQKAGYTVTYTASCAADLAQALKQRYGEQMPEFIYFCSDRRLPTLRETLSPYVQECVIYATKRCGSVIAPAQRRDGVLFFSPSAVMAYHALNPAPVRSFCLGESTANAARACGFPSVYTAPEPNADALIASVIQYFQSIKD